MRRSEERIILFIHSFEAERERERVCALLVDRHHLRRRIGTYVTIGFRRYEGNAMRHFKVSSSNPLCLFLHPKWNSWAKQTNHTTLPSASLFATLCTGLFEADVKAPGSLTMIVTLPSAGADSRTPRIHLAAVVVQQVGAAGERRTQTPECKLRGQSSDQPSSVSTNSSNKNPHFAVAQVGWILD